MTDTDPIVLLLVSAFGLCCFGLGLWIGAQFRTTAPENGR